MQHTTQLSPVTWKYWRIVFTLAAKDIVDAIKNKTTLTMLIGLAMMMLTVEALPLLLKFDDRPRIAIYDAARTGLADEIRRAGAVQVLERRNAEDARALVQAASGPLLALTLPAGWETSSGPLTVNAYLPHWLSARDANELIRQAEAALAGASTRQVTVHTEILYPTLESGGHTTMIAMGIVLATILITTMLVPHLILEEKSTHTLDLLRVSPATINQVLLGKGVAGMVYGVLAAALLLAFNLSMVSLWSVMLPAVLALVLFGVGIGLLVGTLVENEGAVQMWVGLLAVLLLSPLMIAYFGSDRVPVWAQTIARWLPTTAAFDLVRLSFTSTGQAAEIWPRLAAVLVAVVLVFAVAGWRLRTWETGG